MDQELPDWPSGPHLLVLLLRQDDVGILLDAISLGQIIISPLFSESFFHCLHPELTSDVGQDVGPLVSI